MPLPTPSPADIAAAFACARDAKGHYAGATAGGCSPGGSGGGSGGSGSKRHGAKSAASSGRKIARTVVGTHEQRHALAGQFKSARKGIGSRSSRSDLAQQARAMRAYRHGKSKPEERPRGSSRPVKATAPSRTKVGTNEQRSNLAGQFKAARKGATSRDAHSDIAKQARVMRAYRHGKPSPEDRPRGSSRPKPAAPVAPKVAPKAVPKPAPSASPSEAPKTPAPSPLKPSPASPKASPAASPPIPNVDPKLAAHVEHGKYIADEHHRAVESLAKEVGMSPDAYRATVNAKLSEAVAHGEIYMRADSGTLPKILAEGRFKNMFETATTNGSADIDGRLKAESRLFGVSEKSQVVDRPIYGYVSNPGFKSAGSLAEGRLDHYGDAVIRFKPQVRDKATLTVGDSLSRHDMLTGVPMKAPDSAAVPFGSPTWTRNHKELLHADKATFLDRVNREFGYAEAQFHGGLHAHDIAEVAFTNKPGAALRQALEAKGIPWRVYQVGQDD